MASSRTSKQLTKRLPVYAVIGDERFLRIQAVEQLIENILGKDADEMGLAEYDGTSPELELATVLDECRQPSLMAPIRVIVVRDAARFISNYREPLSKYAASPSDCGTLILESSSWHRGSKLHKTLAPVGGVIECKAPEPKTFIAWLIAHAQRGHGLQLEKNAAYRLKDLAGTDLGILDMELAKLSTFIHPQKTIRTADVEELVGATRTELVFGVTDAIALRDPAAALAVRNQVLETDRDAPYKAVGGLAYGFRRLAEAKRLETEGVRLFDIRTQLRLFIEPPVLKRQIDRFSLLQWRRHLVKLLRIDMAAKSGLGTVRTAVEKLIVELCAVA